MANKYDLRLTLREAAEPEFILKQYIARDISFQNPLATGDRLIMKDEAIDYEFYSEPIMVFQTPEPHPKSVIYADVKTFKEHLSRIEQVIEKYNPQEF